MAERAAKTGGRIQREKILEYVRNGTPIHYAHKLAGVNQATFYQWLHRGKNPQAREYNAFVKDLDLALSQWHERLKNLGLEVAEGYEYSEEQMSAQGSVETVQKFKPKDPGMIKWLLEKHFVSTYAKPKEVVLHEGGKPEKEMSSKEASDTAKKYRAILNDMNSETGMIYDTHEDDEIEPEQD